MVKNSTKTRKIEYRRQCIKDIWIGMGIQTQFGIVDALAENYDITVTQATVSRDLATLKQRMIEQTTDDIKSFVLAGYEHIWEEAISAWTKSLKDKTTEIQESTEGDNGGQRYKTQSKTEGQSGNPAHLRNAQDVLKAMRDLWGLDRPKEIDISWRDSLPADKDPDEVLRQFAGLLVLASEQDESN